MIDEDLYNKEIIFQGTKGVVFIGDKMLVYRRDTNTTLLPLHIDLPGGGREGNESPFETFQREIKEEFGISIKSEDVRYAKKYTGTFNNETNSHFFIVTQLLSVIKSEIVFGNEGVEFFLISVQDYLKLEDAIKRQQERVLEYLRIFLNE